MTDPTPLRDFLSRTRRRAVAGVLLDQAVVAAGAGFAGTVLLLLVGSQILDWYWVLLLCAGTFLFGLYRTLHRIPSEYRLAQQVDRRLELGDYLSTAHYFSTAESNGRGCGEFRELVCDRAARLCGEIEPQAAAPIRTPRFAYASLALAAVAVGMFSVRYLTRGSLDLGPPLAPGILDFFRPSWLVAAAKREMPRGGAQTPPMTGLSIDPETGERQDPAPVGEETRLATPQHEAYSAEASSLLDKMRDAFQDMLDKLGLRDAASETGDAASKEGKPGDAPKDGESGESSSEATAGLGTPRPDEKGDEAGPGDGKSPETQKRVSQNNGKDESNGGEGSGIGDAEGDKEIRDAEQLAAMGKLSEILGKRQANLTGEVMVEVTSSKDQKPVTPYSTSDAAHAEGGGEIHRDAVPLAYREFVQQYFEQVRRQAPPAAAPAKP